MDSNIKKGSKIKILRPESYWYLQYGQVMNVLSDDIKYNIQVRFDSENYNGLNTGNYNLSEVEMN